MRKNWLKNKTVVISGASGGLGFAMTKLLIEKFNCKVIGIARNEQKLLAARETLGEKKENFTYRIFDVSEKQNWLSFRDYLIEKDIKIDVLINNAGFMLPFAKFEKYTEEEEEEIIKTNFISYVTAFRTLLPLLKQSSTPALINISSVAGVCPVIGESLYCATKYAVRGFTETLQQDYRKEMYIGGVYPGFIKTDILGRMNSKDKNNKIVNFLMKPVGKVSKKVVKRIAKRKKRTVIGLDGHSMSFFSRLFPKLTPRIISAVLKWSKLDLFDEVFH